VRTHTKREIEYISNKIDGYKKGIDKKINENIKNIIEDLKGASKSKEKASFSTLTPGNKSSINNRTVEVDKSRRVQNTPNKTTRITLLKNNTTVRMLLT
jgi:hypothetical protein